MSGEKSKANGLETRLRSLANRIRVFSKRHYHNLGLRVSLYAVLALVVALAGPYLANWLPEPMRSTTSREAIMPVLSIMASSMLAVSTFSLSIMVSSHQAAASSATPRVRRLMLDDTTTQSVLATFIGAFVYSLISIIAFQAGFYPDSAAVIIMISTILVVVLVIVAMLRWIQHLSTLGSVEEVFDTITAQAGKGLKRLANSPAFGGVPLDENVVLPAELTPVPASRSGFVQAIDVAGIAGDAPRNGAVYVARIPGKQVVKGEILAQVSGTVEDTTLARIENRFVVGNQRSYEQDPVFSLIAFSEISSKALSPGINDPGTAITAIGRMKAVTWEYIHSIDGDTRTIHPGVFVPVPCARELLEAAFAGTARDGAGTIEVALQLRQALKALSAAPNEEMQAAIREFAALAMKHADNANLLECEKDKLRAVKI